MADGPAYTYRANLARIVDGDTFDLDIDLGLGVWKRGERVRLYGVDVAERYTDTGKAAIAFLQEIFPPGQTNPIVVQTLKDKGDKYGRYLVQVFPVAEPVGTSWQTLTDLMIDKGFGTPYFGGARG